MKIVEINHFKEFISLKNTWDSLLEHCDNDVFSTWEWLSTWWKYFGRKKKLLILLAQENNKILGIAPLMYSNKRFFGISQGIIQFIGAENSHTGYNDFIIIDQHQKCIKKFINHLNDISDNWVYSKFIDIPENSKNLASFNTSSNQLRLAHECLSVPLPESFENLLKNVKKRARKSFKSKYRRLKEKFDVELVDYSKSSLVTKGMTSLFDLHQKRWKIKGGFKGMFTDSTFKDFSLDIATTFSNRGWLRLWGLEISGKPVAVSYGFIYNSKFYSNISGLETKFLKYDIGIILRFLIMEKCIHEKIKEYDFLWGNDMWKKRFKPNQKNTYDFIVIRKKLSAKITEFLYTKYTNGKNILNNKLQKK